jgi:hypothetical protein
LPPGPGTPPPAILEGLALLPLAFLEGLALLALAILEGLILLPLAAILEGLPLFPLAAIVLEGLPLFPRTTVFLEGLPLLPRAALLEGLPDLPQGGGLSLPGVGLPLRSFLALLVFLEGFIYAFRIYGLTMQMMNFALRMGCCHVSSAIETGCADTGCYCRMKRPYFTVLLKRAVQFFRNNDDVITLEFTRRPILRIFPRKRGTLESILL